MLNTKETILKINLFNNKNDINLENNELKEIILLKINLINDINDHNCWEQRRLNLLNILLKTCSESEVENLNLYQEFNTFNNVKNIINFLEKNYQNYKNHPLYIFVNNLAGFSDSNLENDVTNEQLGYVLF